VKEKNKEQVVNASERILLVLGGGSVGTHAPMQARLPS
jgi:hypothetical protein